MRNCLLLIFEIITITYQQEKQSKTLVAFNQFISKSYVILRTRLENSINRITFKDNQCKIALQSTYLHANHSQAYFSKAIQHSSKHPNDLSTFNPCMKKKIALNGDYDDKYTNFTFLLIELRISLNNTQGEYDSSILQFNHSYLVYGLCFIDKCSETKDIRNLLYEINNQSNIISGIHDINQIKVNQINYNFLNRSFVSFIPFVILLVHIIVSSWKSALLCFKKCFKDAKAYNDFTNCFFFSENAELLLNYKILSSKINNNSGLTYIRGIKGIFLLLMVLGFVFQLLLNSPIHLRELQVYKGLFSSAWFCFIFVGLRIAPRLLLSCSGYILVFKLMCFLDNHTDINYSKGSSLNFNNSLNVDEIHCDNDNNDQLDLYEKEINKKQQDSNARIPSVSLLFQFLIYQIHYYFICFFFLLSCMYSMGSFKALFSPVNPSWVYFYNTILLDSSFDKFWKSFLFYQSLTIDFHSAGKHGSEVGIANTEFGNIFKYEWMIFNEMIFFVLTSLLIFICYRKRYSLFKIVSIALIVLISMKIGIFAFINRNTTILYSTNYYQMQDYGVLFTNPLYNYSFYLIGVLFGLINFSVQKGLIFSEEIQESNKHYSLPITIAKLFNGQSQLFSYLIGFVGLLLIVTLSCSQFIFISYLFPTLAAFVRNGTMNYYYLIDIEVIVIILHWITFGLFIKGDNLFNSFLSQDIWEVENKLYYSFILILSPVTMILLYQSETRMIISIANIAFYAIISIILTTFLSALFYCLFESPYKRLIHFLLNYNKSKRGEEEVKMLFDSNYKKDE